jgi:hypothetical protein
MSDGGSRCAELILLSDIAVVLLLTRDVAGIEMAHAQIRFSVSVLQEILLKDTDPGRL